jgi:hypothetical protein
MLMVSVALSPPPVFPEPTTLVVMADQADPTQSMVDASTATHVVCSPALTR